MTFSDTEFDLFLPNELNRKPEPLGLQRVKPAPSRSSAKTRNRETVRAATTRSDASKADTDLAVDAPP